MMVAIQAGETDAELNEKDAEIRELRQKVADWNVLERRRPSNVQESAFCDYSRPVGSFGTQAQPSSAGACVLRGRTG